MKPYVRCPWRDPATNSPCINDAATCSGEHFTTTMLVHERKRIIERAMETQEQKRIALRAQGVVITSIHVERLPLGQGRHTWLSTLVEEHHEARGDLVIAIRNVGFLPDGPHDREVRQR